MAILKQKLSKKALDAFVLKYSSSNPNEKGSIQYTTTDNKVVTFVPATALARDGIQEFSYLLGQTFPFFDRKKPSYPLTDLAFIVNEDGKKEFWSGKGAKTRQEAQSIIKKDVASLVQIGMATSLLVISNNQILVGTLVRPVLHKEGKSMDD